MCNPTEQWFEKKKKKRHRKKNNTNTPTDRPGATRCLALCAFLLLDVRVPWLYWPVDTGRCPSSFVH
jgi:hypothetical protein